MDEAQLLGLPLEEALRRWEASKEPKEPKDAGEPPPRVVFTFSGGTHRDPGAGTPRLVAVRGDTWICARFLDGDPRRADA